jgi:hypothetical protein
MSTQKLRLEHLVWTAGGELVGAWWVKNQQDETKKSVTESEDLELVEEACEYVGPILDEWKPEKCSSEDEYVEDLFEYLANEAGDSIGLEMFPDTRVGKPALVIDDALVVELTLNPSESERKRLIGKIAAYSREWVTWVVLVDTPPSGVGAVEKLLADSGLGHILVFAFS